MKTLKNILKEHWIYRRHIIKLAKSDIIKTYKGAALGWTWALIKPAITIAVFYFAFTVGLRQGSDVAGYPFFLWLIAGMIPWFFMRDTLTAGAGSIRRYKYLVTKIKYPVSTIPTFVSFSQFAINFCLCIIMLIIFVCFGHMPDIYWVQIPFYMLLMLLFFMSWSLFAGMLSAISSDFLNLVRSVTTALFWLSGIMYDVNSIDIHWIKSILLYNPITLISNGFRDCLIYHEWFWQNPIEIRNFIIVYVIMTILAVWIYGRLRKDIADVL